MTPRTLPLQSATVADLDALFGAFADPTRLRVMNLLVAGELCVCDIVDILGLPQPTISRHLAALRSVGLVDVTREWKFAHYRLGVPASPVQANLLTCVRSCFVGIEQLDRERRAATARVLGRREAPCD
ncbi:MAG TPA: metalloregulator ArsR/SmtB family transcription factor [Gemmatimonadaceae bacterium]|jgi:ArsR family transcriptional regulator|nr:metalloregulator ArsR/SmtB family transcription factor [Gemmatimonadaceae bacterium]